MTAPAPIVLPKARDTGPPAGFVTMRGTARNGIPFRMTWNPTEWMCARNADNSPAWVPTIVHHAYAPGVGSVERDGGTGTYFAELAQHGHHLIPDDILGEGTSLCEAYATHRTRMELHDDGVVRPSRLHFASAFTRPAGMEDHGSGPQTAWDCDREAWQTFRDYLAREVIPPAAPSLIRRALQEQRAVESRNRGRASSAASADAAGHYATKADAAAEFVALLEAELLASVAFHGRVLEDGAAAPNTALRDRLAALAAPKAKGKA